MSKNKKKNNDAITKLMKLQEEESYDRLNPKWKVVMIDGKEVNYLISNTGIVMNKTTHKILRQQKTEFGYMRTKLRVFGKTKDYKIHRLVAMAFIPNPENKPEVNHIDGNKEHNWYKNLEWNTSKENKQHAIAHGLYDNASFHTRGIQRSTSVYTEAQVHRCCKLLEEGKSPREVAKIMNINKQLPAYIKYAGKWAHIASKYNIPKPRRYKK